tara:strand:- start:2072 stop:2980 length:909 start_codon:yes stop_codon:yes gene_type:complete
MIKNSKVLITGSDGFIGKALCSYLSINNCVVHGISLNKSDNKFIDKEFICDVTDFITLKNKIKDDYEYVFHLAAIADINYSLVNPLEDINVNFLGTVNLMEHFRNSKKIKSFCVFSTVSVLSSENKLPLNEEAFCKPSTPYGTSKMCCEIYAKLYLNLYNLPIKIIRPFNIYGPNKKSLVVYDFIFQARTANSDFKIKGDGKQIRDFLYIDDAVNGIILVAKKGKIGQIYNLGSGVPIKIYDLAKTILKLYKKSKFKIKTDNDFYKGEFVKWYADISKLKDLGFQQKFSLEQGLKKVIEQLN